MAHFAQIDSGSIVINVVVIPDEQQSRGQDFLSTDLGLEGTWIQTSYNTRRIHINGGIPFRKNYAGIGYAYDSTLDAFIPPKKYNSWIFNTGSCCWDPPTPMPTDNPYSYYWDETNLTWVPISKY